jgi:hypothetical protein
MFIPGIAAHRSDRNPQVESQVANAGDIINPGGDVIVGDNETLIKADATAGNMTVTLPDAATVPNVTYKVVKTDTSTNTVTVVGAGGDTIGASTQYVLYKQRDTLTTTSDGTNFVSAVPMDHRVDVRLFNVLGDGVTDDKAAIETAMTQAVDRVLLFPEGDYFVASNLVFTEKVKLERGAKLIPDAGVTLTFQEDFEAGSYQVFDVTNGDVSFAQGSVDQVNAEWVRGSEADAADAINAAMDAGVDLETLVPPGVWNILSDITLDENVKVSPGAQIDVDSDDTLTIDDAIDLPNDEVFIDSSGDPTDGTVTFNDGSVDTVLPVWFGAQGDASEDDGDAIQAAIDAGATNIKQVSIPAGIYNLLSNVDTSTDLLDLGPGAVIDIGGGQSLTIGSGSLDGKMDLHFQGAGDVIFQEDAVEYILPQWWGALGDDSTDNSDAFNAALGAITGIGKMVVPPGIYRFTTPIDEFPTGFTYQTAQQIMIQGSGRANTILKYMGTSDYAIQTWDSADASDVFAHTTRCIIKDMTIRAENLSADGGCVLSMGAHNRFENLFLQADGTYGTGLKLQRRTYLGIEDSFTNDTDRDFTSSGGGATEKFAIAYTTAATVTGVSRSITVRLGKTGAPAGTITASIYDDSGGPNALLGGASQTVSCNSLSAAADGADQEFVINYAELAEFSALTKYWIVLETSGYTYVDGVTEVRLRVEAAGGAANTFATYSGAWALSADGSNNTVEHAYANAQINMVSGVDVGTNSDASRPAYGVNIAESAQLFMSGSIIYADVPMFSIGNPFVKIDHSYLDQTGGGSANYVVDFTNVVNSSFVMDSCYVEGGSSTFPIHLGATSGSSFTNNTLNCYIDWTNGDAEVEFYGNRGPLNVSDDPSVLPSLLFRKKVFVPTTPTESRGIELIGNTTTAVDADSVTGTAWYFDTSGLLMYIWYGEAAEKQYTILPPGAYKITVHAKTVTPDGTDLSIKAYEPNAGGVQIDSTVVHTLTSSYKPYTHIVRRGGGVGKRGLLIILTCLNFSDTYISHVEVEYMGTLEPNEYNLTAFNATEGDADGDRESSINFQGFQSGGEQSWLARIAASHDGAADDEKGSLREYVNDGDDGFSPTLVRTIDSGGGIQLNKSNITYVPIDGDIQAYIDAADAGDTLELASGAYTITSTITVDKRITIEGRGRAGSSLIPLAPAHGTTISCATAAVTAFAITSDDVLLKDLSVNMTGAGSLGISVAADLQKIVFENIYVYINSTGLNMAFSLYSPTAIIRDSTFYIISTDDSAAGVYFYNNSSSTTNAVLDCFTVTGTAVGNTGYSYAFAAYNNNDANSLTLNMTNCLATASGGTAADLAVISTSTTTFNSNVNAYNCILDGADFDAAQSGTNVLDVGGSTLKNSLVQGTVIQNGQIRINNLLAEGVAVTGVDPAVIFDGLTASDTDFWLGLTADEVGDDNDDLQIGKGTTKGTTPFFTWDQDGGFQAQNLTDSVTGFQFLDADGGTPVLNIDTTNERVGIGTASPNRTIDLRSVDQVIADFTGTHASNNGWLDIENTPGLFRIGTFAGITGIASDSSGSADIYVLSTGEVGINTSGPDRMLDALDASNPQLRLTHTDGTVYTDFQTDASGNYTVNPTGGDVILDPGTKHDGYVIKGSAEVQTTNATQTTVDSITLLDENTYHCEAWVVGVESDGSNRASYHIACTVYRTGAGNATLQGGVTSVHANESDATWDATFTVNSNDVRVSVTGVAVTTIEWGATLKYINMSN